MMIFSYCFNSYLFYGFAHLRTEKAGMLQAHTVFLAVWGSYCVRKERRAHIEQDKLRRPPTCSIVWLISVQQLANIDKTSTCCTESKTIKRGGRAVAIPAVLADGGDGGRSPFERRQKGKVFYNIFVLLWEQSACLSCICMGMRVWEHCSAAGT